LFLFSAAALVGCGGGGEGDGDDDGTNPDGGGGVDAPIPDGYTRLIGREWSVPPGGGSQGDVYKCARVTLTADTYITNIQSLAPIGSHHAVLSIADSRVAGPDGNYDCSVSTLGRVMLYASGVGTSPLDFPTDVGIHLAAGTQIHLNLHLYNASDSQLNGDSAILVKQQATPPPILAEMVFAGKFLFTIPGTPQGQTPQPYSTSGGCNANRAFTLFAVWPHQHKIGSHHKFEIIRGGGNPSVLHDRAYSFEEQNYYLQTPEVQVAQGDQIRVTCTWINPGTGSVGFGDSSDTEMCFSGMYRYPATQGGSNLFQCTDTGGAGF
jgi:hypothetical protein